MTKLDWLEGGGVTSPQGFTAGAVHAGIKNYGPEPRYDVGMLASDRPATAAGVFTKNRVCGAPVELCRERLRSGRADALVVNSGCSNVAMGERGRVGALRVAALGPKRLGLSPDHVLVASTGVIGRPLPMSAIEPAIRGLVLGEDAGASFSRAIMTTDTVAKHRAVRITADGRTYTIGGTVKGSGMVHPDMATVLCFLTTDAPVDVGFLREVLKATADVSLNMVDVDMDTSTSDSMIVFANGAAGGAVLRAGHPTAGPFREALEVLCIELARDLARDGEGARVLIEVRVEGARSVADARRAARTVASSPLVKTMVTGRDANLGRVMMAIGRSGADVDVDRASVWIGQSCAFERGTPTVVPYETLSREMAGADVLIRVDLGLGEDSATAWGCDLTEEYVRINADYTT
jgi:glutamate N-acetyltransferase / amino-acid N-acetyltransferase